MPILPTKRSGESAGGTSREGGPREGYRSNRADRRNRARRELNRANRVPPWGILNCQGTLGTNAATGCRRSRAPEKRE
eukprot:14531737-Alexandrium_andersonii.AAC.1